jgi:hypothetical protein
MKKHSNHRTSLDIKEIHFLDFSSDIIDQIGLHLSPNLNNLFNFQYVCKNTRHACKSKHIWKQFLVHVHVHVDGKEDRLSLCTPYALKSSTLYTWTDGDFMDFIKYDVLFFYHSPHPIEAAIGHLLDTLYNMKKESIDIVFNNMIQHTILMAMDLYVDDAINYKYDDDCRILTFASKLGLNDKVAILLPLCNNTHFEEAIFESIVENKTDVLRMLLSEMEKRNIHNGCDADSIYETAINHFAKSSYFVLDFMDIFDSFFINTAYTRL